MMVVFILVALALAAYGLVRFFPGFLPWLRRALSIKDRLFQIGVLAFALMALWSGYLLMVLVGAAIFLIAFVLIFDEYSLRDIKRKLT